MQGSFRPKGKISHKAVTKYQEGHLLRYVNFVEMNTPLFEASKLFAFLDEYDLGVDGWGIDWWYLNIIGYEVQDKIAVVDDIRCINPRDAKKQGGKREITKLAPIDELVRRWEKVKEEKKLKEFELINYKAINKHSFWAYIERVSFFLFLLRQKSNFK